jgi:hypothetical protein
LLPLSRWQERWLYAAALALLASGLGWMVTHYFFMQASPFGPTPSALEPWWLRLHGAAMLLFLVLFGTLMPRHIPIGWRLRRQHVSGALLIVAVSLLAVTGWCLYYIGDDRAWAFLGVLHWGVGLAATAVLITHATAHRRARRQARAAAAKSARSPEPADPRSARADAAAHRRH